LLTFAVAASLPPVLSACAVAGTDRYERHRSELRELTTDDDAIEKRVREGAADPVAGATVLERDALVVEVLAKNPTLDVARHAWRASIAAFPQMTALDDPMASYMFAPFSIPGIGGGVPFGQEVMLTQPLPFPGRLDQRGAVVLADADAMRAEFEAARLSLALMASMLHADYFQNARQIAVNEEHQALLTTIRGALQARFEAGEESLQGPLGAELELAHVEHDHVRLSSERDVIVARINELIHRPPKSPLPPPPPELPLDRSVGQTPDALFEEAVKQRPELAALRARVAAAAAERGLAETESWPDFSVSAAYNSMWSDPQHQFMIGGALNIPIQLERRSAAVDQAESKRRQRDAELEAQLDAVHAEVETERRRTVEALHVVRLFDERTVPIAEAVVDASRAGLETGQTSFLEMLEAERELRMARLERTEAVAALHQQFARLDRALGRAPNAVARKGERQ
jgi:outer membrane protein TolC